MSVRNRLDRFWLTLLSVLLTVLATPAAADDEGTEGERAEAVSRDDHETVVATESTDTERVPDSSSTVTPVSSSADTNKALVGADAVTAVSPQRISLPNAEGSVEGMGESFAPVLSSGTATFSVPFALPAGRGGVQPSFGLSYASTNGNGPVGIGWSLGVPAISRQTDRGLPRYRDRPVYHPEEDRFIYNGGQELVPVNNAAMAAVDASGLGYTTSAIPAEVTGWQQYRARVEGGFMRFFRSPDGTGWVVQSKDGTRFDFGLLAPGDGPAGLDSSGSLMSEYEAGSGRVYSWLLTRMSDAHGSTVYYRYLSAGGSRYVSEVFYLSPHSCAAGGNAAAQRQCSEPLSSYGARVRFDYDARPDVFSSYTSGWRVDVGLRLSRVTVTAAGPATGSRFLVRRYHLAYEPSIFHSMLASVTVEGRPDRLDESTGPMVRVLEHVPEGALGASIVGRTLPPMRFSYSSAPAGGIAGFGGVDATVRPVVSSPGVSLDYADTTLADVNSDGLPDVVVTDPARYRMPNGSPAVGVYFNGFRGERGQPAGRTAEFSSPVPVEVQGSRAGILRVSSATLVPMDVDGDGRGDFLHMPRIDRYGYFAVARTTPEHRANVADQGWRFTYAEVELDRPGDDPRIDLLRRGEFCRAFDANNDHLTDVVCTTGTVMQTWLNLGFVPGGEGRFGQASHTSGGWQLSTEPIESCLLQDGLPVDFSDPELRLGDMNGDGIEDIIRMRRGRVVYWPGRGVGLWGDGPSTCARGQGDGRAITMATPPVDLAVDLDGAFLVDVNADGAADILQVRYREIDIWFNRAGRGFTQRFTVNTPFAPRFMPNVTFADIDGSGTTDLVYGTTNSWTYLDLLGGQRPRLLVGVDNGLGASTSIEYGASSEDYVADLEAYGSCAEANCEAFTWDHVRGDSCDAVLEARSGECVYRPGGSPVISSVVRAVETTDNFSAVGRQTNSTRTEFLYHNGYYEGIEQEFRGFGAAEAVAVGDAWQPTAITRSYFLQGRRPNELASDRLADNPYEALKGREYLTEQRDESGVYLSSGHATFTVRRLAYGLDGRAVSYAYVSSQDNFTYDTHHQASSRGGGPTLTLGRFAHEAVSASGAVPAAAEVEAHSLRLRSDRYAWTRSTSDRVDNLGHVLQQTAHGRLHDEGDGGDASEISYGEAIVSHTVATSLNAGGRWLFRTSEQWLVGDGYFGQRLGWGQSEYNELGDLIRSQGEAKLPSGYASGFDFSGDATSATLSQSDQVLVASTAYDAWGSATATCVGGDLSTGTTSCGRYSKVEYDSAYAQLPLRELTALHTGGGAACQLVDGFCMVGSTATWDRGLGAVRSVTDPNAQVSTVGYDGLGRITYVKPPAGQSDCASQSDLAVQTFAYEIAPGGLPVSVIHATTDPLDGECASAPLYARSYVDGLGRARASLSLVEVEGTPRWTQSGIASYGRRGQVISGFNARYLDATGDPSARDAVRLDALTPSVTTMSDAFGRPTRLIERDGTYSTVTYGATSRRTYDANDLGVGPHAHPAHVNTPSIERVDGHGRVIDSVQLLRGPDGVGAPRVLRLLKVYRPDGAVWLVGRAETATEDGYDYVDGHFVYREFIYDTAGRRIASTDPDTDSRTNSNSRSNRHRYLYSPLGDLVAVRDPRGCGQDFYYDLAGRLLGEDYVTCGEALEADDVSYETVPAGSLSLGTLGAEQTVDVRYEYDELPMWVHSAPGVTVDPGLGFGVGRATGVSDRAQRSAVAYDAAGNASWSARQVAVLPAAPGGVPEILSGHSPAPTRTELVTPTDRVYDEAHTYVSTTRYDRAGRVQHRVLPRDPDWTLFGGVGAAPRVIGSYTYGPQGMTSASVSADQLTGSWGPPAGTLFSFETGRVTRNARGLVTQTQYGLGGANPITRSSFYDARDRPVREKVERANAAPASLDGDTLRTLTVVSDHHLTWDGVNNLVRIRDDAGPDGTAPGHRRTTRHIAHDSLYRVAQVAFEYFNEGGWTPDDAATDWRDERTRTNLDGKSHGEADPMRRKPAPMVAARPAERVKDLTYAYDWLANQTEWYDDADSFYERSIGNIESGNAAALAGEGLRPSALYLATNLPDSEHGIDVQVDRGGYVELRYGESGNVETMTVHAQCRDASTALACYLERDEATGAPTGSLSAQKSRLGSRCACASAQHYDYRWDELSRLAEARRYDQSSATAGPGQSPEWKLAVRQRYRYDGSNARIVKETIEGDDDEGDPDGAPDARAHLYVYPGEFERSGVTANHALSRYDADLTLGTETQYLVSGARVVWKSDTSPLVFDREHRVTMAIGDLIQSTSAVFDVPTGELLELTTFYPNGARETHRTTHEASYQLELSGFTGKEADEEVGLVYFGERYLIPRIGRWASADPLAVHAVGGGEALNSYHYVGGNLLQGRDPDGLECGVDESCDPSFEASSEWSTATVSMSDGSAASEAGHELETQREVERKQAAWRQSRETQRCITQCHSRDEVPVGHPTTPEEEAFLAEILGAEASLVPGVGDAMDAHTVGDPDAPTSERVVAGASLTLGVLTGGISPNATPVIRILEAADDVRDAARSDVVYRALREGEDPSIGLRARSPGAETSVGSHVMGARESSLISTTRSEETARTLFNSGNGVVEIDLSRVNGRVIDASEGVGRGRVYSRTRAHQEVLVDDSGAEVPIPAEAIRWIEMPQ